VYNVTPPTYHLLAPETDSRAAETRPPVDVSATEIVAPFELRSFEISLSSGWMEAGGKE
jgi:hypothetical protein